MKFICNIEVKYANDVSMAPDDRVREINGKSDNVNHQFGGSCVWLVPKFTPDNGRGAALTSFYISIQKDVDDSVSDLAKGSGGDYRYLLFNMDATTKDKVTEVALLRLGSQMDGRPAGWNGNTTNINAGRPGEFLYLLWKTA